MDTGCHLGGTGGSAGKLQKHTLVPRTHTYRSRPSPLRSGPGLPLLESLPHDPGVQGRFRPLVWNDSSVSYYF